MKVVVTDISFPDYDIERALFAKMGVEFVVADCQSTADLVDVAKDADGLLNAAFPLTAERLALLPQVKVICRYGIGVDTIDITAASKRGIYVANVQDYCHDEVADHALALILSATRKIVCLNQRLKKDVHANVYEQAPIRRIKEQTVGLISFGNIARNLATKLQAVGYSVIAYDPYCLEDTARRYHVKLVPLEELMSQADIISVHTPLNAETHHLINAERLSLVKRECWIVNTGRGAVIDETALIDAIKNKKLAGAALDVFEKEPLDPANPLLQLDQVVMTPHAAFYSDESCAELKQKAVANIVSVFKSGTPTYWVNQSLM